MLVKAVHSENGTYVEPLDKNGSSSSMDTIEIVDENVLAACGYKQELKRDLNFFSTFSVSFDTLSILPGIASTMIFSMGYAGTPGMTWGWLIASFFVQFVAASMAELASSMPTAGSLYYAAAVLAPPAWGPLASYLVGWSNWIALLSAGPSLSYALASMLLATVTLHVPEYVVHPSHIFGVAVALIMIVSTVCSLPIRLVGRINLVGAYLQMGALIIFLIAVPAATTNSNPKFNPSSQVWGSISNGTEWPNGVAVMMSFLAAIWTMAGYDAPFHMSEECSNAQIAVPRAIVLTVISGGLLGFFMNLVIAYTVVDVIGVVTSPLGQPFVAYCLQVISLKWTTCFVAFIIVTGELSSQGITLTCSRVAYAYARDGVLPFSSFLSRVHPTTKVPLYAVWFNTILQIAMLCLIFAGPIAVNAIFSYGAVAQYFAFIVPIFIRVFFAGDRFRPGPWSLGKWSRPCGAVACAFVTLIIPVLLLPAVHGADLNKMTMNWAVLVWGGPMFLALMWFLIHARKTFKGPKINVEHLAASHHMYRQRPPSFRDKDSFIPTGA